MSFLAAPAVNRLKVKVFSLALKGATPPWEIKFINLGTMPGDVTMEEGDPLLL